MFFKLSKKFIQVTGRDAEMLTALMRGPVPCPNVKRNSAAVHNLRRLGVDIFTQRVANCSSPGWHGVYHLRSRVKRASQREVATYAKAKAAPAVKAVSA